MKVLLLVKELKSKSFNRKGYAKIGIDAPKSLMILRKELLTQIKDENLHSVVKNDVKLDDLSKKLIP